MDRKKAKKIKKRKARKAMRATRLVSLRELTPEEMNIHKEVDYMIGRALMCDARMVTLGKLILFSIDAGDAWMLDVEDSLALCLARNGVRQPFGITETKTNFAIQWDRSFAIENDCFVTLERKTGRTSAVMGYPIKAIQEGIERTRMV